MHTRRPKGLGSLQSHGRNTERAGTAREGAGVVAAGVGDLQQPRLYRISNQKQQTLEGVYGEERELRDIQLPRQHFPVSLGSHKGEP